MCCYDVSLSYTKYIVSKMFYLLPALVFEPSVPRNVWFWPKSSHTRTGGRPPVHRKIYILCVKYDKTGKEINLKRESERWFTSSLLALIMAMCLILEMLIIMMQIIFFSVETSNTLTVRGKKIMMQTCYDRTHLMTVERQWFLFSNALQWSYRQAVEG